MVGGAIEIGVWMWVSGAVRGIETQGLFVGLGVVVVQ